MTGARFLRFKLTSIRFSGCCLALAPLSGFTACKNNTEPASGGSGSVAASVATTGSDLDPDGYTVALDQGSPQPIGANVVTFQGLAVGAHSVVLAGLASNCTTTTPQSVQVTAGQTAAVTFQVACTAFPIFHPAGTVVATVALPDRPYGVTVSPQGITYVALISGDRLLKGDLASRTFPSSVGVGETPAHVVIDAQGKTAYATLQTAAGVAVVDVATNTLTATIPLSNGGFNLLLSRDGARLYVTTADGTLFVINTATLAVVTTVAVGPVANGLVLGPDGSILYVSSRGAGTVTAIGTQTNTIQRVYLVGGAPQRIAISPDGSEVYVANEDSGLNVVNVATGAVTSIDFGTKAYGLGLTPDGAQLYVLLPLTGEVRVLDRASRAALRTILVGGTPRNVTFTASGRTALVTNEEAVVFIE